MIGFRTYSSNHIDMSITLDDRTGWQIIGFYGFPKKHRRRESWNLINMLASQVEVFPDHSLINLTAGVSDHNPILLKILQQHSQRIPRRFRFENAWLKEVNCDEVIKQSWLPGGTTPIGDKINNCKVVLGEWSSKLNMQFKEEKTRIYEKLKQAQGRSNMDSIVIEEKIKLNIVSEKEDTYWKQRAKAFWLHFGDLNTKYFHAQASSRKKLNTTPLLQSASGELVSSEDDKARSLDVVSRDVVRSCQQWLRQWRLPKNINATFLVLIGKIDKPVNMKDFRPIALCNVLYKILSKVLANRLKSILPLIVSPSQSAFVPGRKITDNIVIAFELIHSMRRKKRGKYGDVVLKLDISKAYDRVDWRFFEFIMRKMGFHAR
ncbi:uncharacterized protein [Rutidosis leptorrhynchoides]|uniref:uncharacterized protein n=1 Tax=Rutidosis leptorrhynchoides TaxID=125765 RepID=UPI003A9A36CB